jgi:CheY-like chemotaxis protein
MRGVMSSANTFRGVPELADRPRILAFTGPDGDPAAVPSPIAQGCDLVTARSLQEGLTLLQSEAFEGMFADVANARVRDRVLSLLQTGAVLEVMDDGVALLDKTLQIIWANASFERWVGERPQGKDFLAALGGSGILPTDPNPFPRALAGKNAQTRIQKRDGRFIETRVTPLADRAGNVIQLITLSHDITRRINQQQILDSLHQATNDLASLDVRQLGDMSVQDRVELLKFNIRKLTHDLLHYDVIEIRLLDQESGRLEPLMAEGMTAEAAKRVLYASVDGNGVTGYVAATGKSYICRDVANDPHYIMGAEGARSSLTVAIQWDNKVIGTFNVESPKLDGFTEQDVQFAEIFCRELAAALHTLDLLLVEKRTTASQSIEAISREVALPVDEILNGATSVLDRWIGHEPEMEEKLRIILDRARSIRQSIQKVGEDFAPASKPLSFFAQEAPHKLKNKRILVVDNDERVRRSAHSLLGRLGGIVETARDGKEAVTMARLSNYDAMLADIRLPDMSGYEVYRLLRLAQPKARVILMTGYGYDPSHALVKARQDGLKHVLYKPFRVEQMLSALDGDPPAGKETGELV